MATGISTNTSYPAHPYQSSSDLATTLVQNGLCGIAAYDLAKKKSTWLASAAPGDIGTPSSP